MTSENQIIPVLSRERLSTGVQDQARALLATPLDWDVILERVMAEEIYPLFYRNLAALGFAGVPMHAREQLQKLSKINGFRNTLLTEELVRVLNLLSEAGVPAIPLKGP